METAENRVAGISLEFQKECEECKGKWRDIILGDVEGKLLCLDCKKKKEDAAAKKAFVEKVMSDGQGNPLKTIEILIGIVYDLKKSIGDINFQNLPGNPHSRIGGKK